MSYIFLIINVKPTKQAIIMCIELPQLATPNPIIVAKSTIVSAVLSEIEIYIRIIFNYVTKLAYFGYLFQKQLHTFAFMKETIIVVIGAILIHALEALHDYAVINTQSKDYDLVRKWNKRWHTISTWAFLAFYITISILQSNFWLIIIGASIRGIIFWPLLNHLLDRNIFYTSNHFPEKYFRNNGYILFVIYFIIYITSFILSCQTYN